MVEPDKQQPPARLPSVGRDTHEPWQAAPAESLASWLAGHAQAMAGGDRDPALTIGDTDSWYLGYDVGTRDRQEGDDSTIVDNPMTPT